MQKDLSAGKGGCPKQVKSEWNQDAFECETPSLSPGSLNFMYSIADGTSTGTNGRTGDGKKKCVICGGIANGYHFGALSCPACNAFFRRSVADSRKYSCRGSGHCDVDQSARCICRACRLKKCYECGMDASAVQPRRDWTGKKRKCLGDEQRAESEEPEISLTGPCGSDIRSGIANDIARDVAAHIPSQEQRKGLKSALACPRSSITSNEPSSPRCTSAFHLTVPSRAGHALKRPSNSFSQASPCSGCLNDSSPIDIPVPNPSADESFCPRQIKNFAQTIASTRALKIFDLLSDGGLCKYINASSSPLSLPQAVMKESPSNDIQSTSFAHMKQPSRSDRAANRSATKADYDPSSNIIEVLLNEYSELCERRRMMYYRGPLRKLLDGEQPALRRVSLGTFTPTGADRHLKLTIEFMNLIHPFAKLRLDDREAVAKNALLLITSLERYYRTMKLGGIQANRCIRYDHTYYDLAQSEEQQSADNPDFDIATSDQSSQDRTRLFDWRTFTMLAVPLIRESLSDTAAAMVYSCATNAELVALIVNIVLDPAVPNLSDAAKRMLKKARDRLYVDWFAYYEAHNIPDAAERVGRALLLLPAVHISARRGMEYHHMNRVFKLFDVPPLLNEILFK